MAGQAVEMEARPAAHGTTRRWL